MPKVLGIVDGTSGSDVTLETKGNFIIPVSRTKREFYVLADTVADDEVDIINTPGLPVIGEFYSVGSYCIKLSAKEQCTVIHPTTHVPTILWIATADYSSQIDSGDISGGTPGEEFDPTDMRPRRHWYCDKEKEALDRDAQSGAPIQTINKEKYSLEKNQVIIVLEIERYENYPWDPLTSFKFCDHSNNASFYGAPTGTALIDDIDVQEEYVNGGLFLKVRYRILFKLKIDPDNPDSFLPATMSIVQTRHEGYLYRPTPGAEPVKYIDGHGQPKKVLLTSNTDFLLDEWPGGLLNEFSDEEYQSWYRFPYADFSELDLEF